MTQLTLTDQTPRAAYVVGGTPQAIFAVAFSFFATSDIDVYVAGVLMAEGVDYTVAGTAEDDGFSSGTITLTVAVSNTTVVVERNVPIERTSNFPTGTSTLNIRTLNTQLTKVFAILQQVRSLWTRAVRLSPSDTRTALELPTAAEMANKYLAGSSDGSLIVATGTTPGTVPVTAFAATLLDDADATAGRATLAAAGTGANTFTADQTIRSTDAGAGEGPSLVVDRNSASPAASDLLGALRFDARSSTAVQRAVAKILPELLDPTNASEDARLLLQTIVAGTLATRLTIGQGLVVGAATGGDQGPGTINATEVYRNGAALLFSASYDSGDLTITAGGAHTLTHSLGGVPRAIFVYLKNVTGEGGYTTGQEVLIQAGENADNTQARGLSVIQTSTQILLRVGSDANSFLILAADTGGRVSIVNANWRLVIRAYR